MRVTEKGQAKSDAGAEAEAWSWGRGTVPRRRRRPNWAFREEKQVGRHGQQEAEQGDGSFLVDGTV